MELDKGDTFFFDFGFSDMVILNKVDLVTGEGLQTVRDCKLILKAASARQQRLFVKVNARKPGIGKR